MGDWAEGYMRNVQNQVPMALSFVVTGTIWRWMLAPSGGVNIILTFNWQHALYIVAVIVAVILLVRAIRGWNRKGFRGDARHQSGNLRRNHCGGVAVLRLHHGALPWRDRTMPLPGIRQS